MIVTGNGVLIVVEDEDDLFGDLFRALMAAQDTVDDDAAEHADEIACFLQDADVYTPMDELADSPMAMGGLTAWLEWIG
jgi:hypothetical protein